MSDPETVKKLRASFNAAHSEFNRQPSPKTKKAYTEASAALNHAIIEAKRNGFIEGKEGKGSKKNIPWREKGPEKLFAHLEPETAAYLDDLREKQNLASRLRYAMPNESTHENLRKARNLFRRERRKLDPEYAAKLQEYADKSAAKLSGDID